MMHGGFSIMPEPVLLKGAEALSVAEGMAPYLCNPPVTDTGEEDDLSGWNGQLLVLCAGDDEELDRLLAMTSGLPVGGHTVTVVLSGSDSAEDLVDPIIRFRYGDFAYRILAALPGYHMIVQREGGLIRMPLWQNTGALLPFFVHNMNNILARIMGNAELARMYSEDPKAARQKMDSALAGVEDMKKFVQSLAGLSVLSGTGAPWTRDSLDNLERTGRMFCGRSVEFTYDTDGELPASLPCPAAHPQLTAGLAAASAAVMVNGNGTIGMTAEGSPGGIDIIIEWTARTGRTGLIDDVTGAATELMGNCAALCHRFGFGLALDDWDGSSGRLSIRVPGYREGALHG